MKLRLLPKMLLLILLPTLLGLCTVTWFSYTRGERALAVQIDDELAAVTRRPGSLAVWPGCCIKCWIMPGMHPASAISSKPDPNGKKMPCALPCRQA